MTKYSDRNALFTSGSAAPKDLSQSAEQPFLIVPGSMASTTRLPSRRRFVQYGGAVGALAGVERLLPPAVASLAGPGGMHTPGQVVISGSDGPIALTVAETPVQIGGRTGRATTINGTVPGPLLRFREGDEAVIHVTNKLDQDTSIHWHGILVPNEMDGVPWVTYPGIRPGETFTYRFPVKQYGTYWYHSHSGLQEQTGHYGPLIIDPADGEPAAFDREHVIVLSDWTFEDPDRLFARLRKQPDYYNFRKRTAFDFFRDAAAQGLGAAVRNRLDWGRMRMAPTDIADVTGATYTYLMNGAAPGSNWTGLFSPGERVRLRFINASAASFFDVRIPGLPMKVIQASGQHVRPVETDEIRIAIAETYDVIVGPAGDRAYTVFAEAMDRSGFARGTLAPAEGMEARVPARRARPLLTMADMGMASGAMEGMGHDMTGMERAMPMPMPTEPGEMGGEALGLRAPGTVPEDTMHGPDHHGPGNAAVPMATRSRLHEPGVGLGEDGHHVLVYTDLMALHPNPDLRAPDREIELHLTGNMERFVWSIDGKTLAESEPIHVALGERIRLTLVNDTMMNHPMHLHGMWMELENGADTSIPRVHTVNVKPAERVSLLFTADAPGAWAFHCHVLYHMNAGMFRVVQVGEGGVGGVGSGGAR